MKILRVRAHAKINLALQVEGKRADGYHNLSTIMHQIPLYDDVELTLGAGSGIATETNFNYIRTDTNIATKAARRFFAAAGIPEPGLLIRIFKRIPVGAGLGGGSADAAAVLLALNAEYGAPISSEQLNELAAKVGADVPFCLAGGCALCEGIGEQITELPTLPSCALLVVKPKASISTAQLFSEYDAKRQQRGPDIPGMIRALETGAFEEIARRVFNVLELYAERHCPEIATIHRELLYEGAIGAGMSGSGSAVFGLFKNAEHAKSAKLRFSTQYSDVFLLQDFSTI